jgi:colanic acid/amylovoran biosynthesis protein
VRIIIFGVSPNDENRGLSALTFGSLKYLFERFPGSEILILEYSKDPVTYMYNDKKVFRKIEIVTMRFSKEVFLSNNIAMLLAAAFLIKIVPFKGVIKHLENIMPVLKIIRSADICSSISGGDSFSDIYGLGRLIYVALPQILFILCNKPLIQLPQTFGPFKFIISRIGARWILNHCESIYYREYESEKIILQLDKTLTNKSHFRYDVGFLLNAVESDRVKKIGSILSSADSKICGFNISGLLYRGGYSGKNQFNLAIDYKIMTEAILESIIDKYGYTAILLPHVYGNKYESDSVICKEIYPVLKIKYNNKIMFFDEEFSAEEVKYLIGECNLFIGARMHACIAAMSQNVPTICLAYSRKFIGVLQSISLPECIIELYKPCDDFRQTIDNIIARNEEIKILLSRENAKMSAHSD